MSKPVIRTLKHAGLGAVEVTENTIGGFDVRVSTFKDVKYLKLSYTEAMDLTDVLSGLFREGK